MRIKKLYLAGSIEGLSYEEATDMRNKATDLLSDIGIQALDPMRNKDALKGAKSIGHDKKSGYEMQEIIARDITDIREADGIIVLSGDHPSWGTAMEFSFTYFVERKPVFMISKDKSRYGWAGFLATKICSSLEELRDYLRDYWR